MKTGMRSLLAALLCVLTATAHAADPKIQQKQNDIRDMAQQTLQRLYKAEPKAKSAVASAAGYAVFSNMGIKILVAGSGNGKGLAVNNKTKHETFMKMLEVQAGLGMGVKKFSVIFVFDTQKALDAFINSGWDFGGQTTAAATTGNKAQPWPERRRSLMASGCINSLTKASPSKLLPRAPSTTKIAT
jgi:lipid-binding SYLF domain-containing protein